MKRVKEFVKIPMEPFKDLKRHLKLIGVLFENSTPKEKQLALMKNYVTVFCFVSSFISTARFRLFSAHSTREISMSNFFTLVFLLLLAWYSTLIWQRQKYAAILGELVEKIDQSKYSFN